MPPQDPLFAPAPDSRDGDTDATRPRKLRPAVVLSVIAVIAVVASLVFFLRPGDGGNAAAPAGTAPTSEAALPPAPEVTYYQQPGPPAGSPLEPVEPLQVSVTNDQVGTSLTKGLVGISLEATDLADPMLSGDNASLVKLFKEADQPVLRFGGNAVDRRFFWTSANEAVPSTGYKGDKAHPVRAVGPADLARLNTLLEAADATVSLTVDLGHYDPERAADMAKHATEIFGPRLLSFTVGNEPNGFGANGVRPGGYSTEQYVEELKAYANAMNAVAPNVPISGPGAYDRKWWQPFIDADIPQKKILSFHNYPLHSCDGGDPKSSPTIANVMSPLMHQRADDYQRAALEVAQAAGLETWLPETGIAACPGSNETSRTHASALWTADYALNAAQLGITRIGFHSSMLTCKGGPPMSAICSGGAYLKPDGNFTGRANYFGISMVAEMEGGKYLKLDTKGGGLMYSYALRNDDGSTSVVLINQNDPEKAAQTEVTLNLPERALTGTMTQMAGPSYAAEDSTVIDGAKSEPVPLAERATVEGFAYGSRQQTFKLTAGTVTVLNFKH